MASTASRPAPTRLAAFLATTSLATSLALTAIVAPPSPAAADTAPPPGAPVPATVSSDALPTPQIDGVVWDQEIVGDTVYVGGNFTSARPAGAAPSASTVPRSHLLAYRLSTGELLGWAPVVNAQVRALDASPDGSRLYAVGAFTSVDGVVKNRIVAFDTATGATSTTFRGSANGEVFAVDSTADTVYFAGNFSQTGGVARPGRAAAATAASGAPTAWAPVLAGGRAFGLVVSPDATRAVLAGSFTSMNGAATPGYGLGAVDVGGGASLPFALNSTVRNAGDSAAIYSLAGDGDSLYGSGYVFGSGGNLEGVFRADWSGNLTWIQDCHGDTYGVAATGDVVYTASHAHYCGNLGGFPENSPRKNTRAVAFSKSATGTLTRDIYGYPSFTGTASPSVLNWFPTINAGTFTGQVQGPWTVSANAQYVVYGGEFTTVNGVSQQGLVRFAVGSIAPNKDKPRVSGASWPIRAASYSAGTVAVSWPSNHDRDNSALSYAVRRDGVTMKTVASSSTWWDRPGLSIVDRGLTPGGTHTYTVVATDPYGNSTTSGSATVTVAASGTFGGYAQQVITDSPTWYFRLGESGATTPNTTGPVANTTTQGEVTQAADLTVGSGATRAQPGAIAADPDGSTRFAGTSASRAYTTAATWVDDSITVEAWIKSTASSGKLVGFGSNGSSANSGTYDRHLYLNSGRVLWGVNDGTNRTLQSAAAVNDGAWHHVVGTIGPAGQSLYVDGVLAGTAPTVVKGARYWGYWRIGGDSTWAGTQNFVGDIDEVAIYKTVLDAAAISRHHQLGVTGAPPANTPPTASATATADLLTATVNGSASSDPDGSIASWAWDFGDGTTGTGTTATHTYAADGTYTVTLTVTDDLGASAQTTVPITIAGPVVPPAGTLARDPFTRTVSGGWGSAEVGGGWTPSSAANFQVDGTTGTVAHGSAASTRRAVLASVSSANSDLTATVGIDQAATGGGVVAGLVGRQVGSEFYQGRIRFTSTGGLRVEAMRGSSTLLAAADLAGATYTPGQRLNLRVQVIGVSPTTVQIKAWPVGSAEPAAWAVSTTDATATLQAAGSVGVESYVSGSATTVPVVVRWDDLLVRTP